MSHPVPGMEYDSEYEASRRKKAISKALKVKNKNEENVVPIKHKGKITQKSWDRIIEPLKKFNEK